MAKKKTKQKEAVKKEVYLTYTEDRSVGEICAGQENDAWPNYEDIYIEFSPDTLSIIAGDWVETIEVDFDPKDYVGKDVYVLVVRYKDGCTFGHSHGNWYVEGAYTDENEVSKIEDQINKGKYKGDDPWTGYFACLEYVEIHRFTLDRGYKKIVRRRK